MPEASVVDAFSEFRAKARDEIRPPGVAAAHAAVARRRAARVALTAALVCVVVGASFFAIHGLVPSPAGPASPDAGPTLSGAELDRLAEGALRELGVEPGTRRPGTLFGPMIGSTDGFKAALGTTEQPFPHGHYVLSAVCVGHGSVTITWSAAGATGSLAAGCGAGVRQTPFDLAVDDIFAISIQPDAQAQDRAGVAVILTDPLTATAETALAAASTRQLFGGSGFASAPRGDSNQVDTGAGTYRVLAACAGTGNLKLTLTIDGAATSTTVACSATPILTGLILPAATANRTTVLLEPDAAALNSAGYAYYVAKD